MLARLGSMLAPFIATDLARTIPWVPPVVLGSILIVGAVLVIFLPGKIFMRLRFQKILTFAFLETRGFRLPETLEDGENFGKKGQEKVDREVEDVNVQYGNASRTD